MPRAVRFDNYGGLEVLQVVEVDRPTPGETVVVSGAAGRVGSIAVRLVKNAGARASTDPRDFPQLRVFGRFRFVQQC